jgi:hypothetical protein
MYDFMVTPHLYGTRYSSVDTYTAGQGTHCLMEPECYLSRSQNVSISQVS